MTTLLRPRAVGGVNARVEPSAVERSLARYPTHQQSRVFGLASRHRRLADLAVTFPGLLFALAGREGDAARAIDLAIGGAPLKAVATAAGVPLWLRRLPPEAFAAPLRALPDGERFRRRIANHLPRSPKAAPFWLAAVRIGADWGNDDLAVWIAREVPRRCKGINEERLHLLALYAWYSGRPETIAHQFLHRRWDAGMSRDRALYEAREWLEAVILSLELATRNLDPWLIRRDGERVATLSVGFRAPILDILQLKGPANAEAPNEIWVATRRWIDRHDLMAIERAWAPHQEVPFDRAAWVASWRPFWLAKRRIPSWLPLRPSRGALDRLFNSRR